MLSTDEQEVAMAMCSLKCTNTNKNEHVTEKQDKVSPKTVTKLKPKNKKKGYFCEVTRKWLPPEAVRSLLFPIRPPLGYSFMPNTDARNSYPKMIMENLSLGDREIFLSVMTQICVEDLKYVSEYDGDVNPYGPNYREVNGVQNVADFLLAVLNSAPDCLLNIRKESIVSHKNNTTNEAFIAFKLLLTHTKLAVVVENNHPYSNLLTSGGNNSGGSSSSGINSNSNNNNSNNSMMLYNERGGSTAANIFHSDINQAIRLINNNSDSIKSDSGIKSNSSCDSNCDNNIDNNSCINSNMNTTNSADNNTTSELFKINSINSCGGSSGSSDFSADTDRSSITSVSSFSSSISNDCNSVISSSGSSYNNSSNNSIVANNSSNNNNNKKTDRHHNPLQQNAPNFASNNGSVYLDSLSFGLKPLKGPKQITHNCSKYVLIINANNKITKIFNCFCITSEEPAVF